MHLIPMGKAVRSVIAHYGRPAITSNKNTLQLHDEADYKPVLNLEPDTQRIELIEKSSEFNLTHVIATRSCWLVEAVNRSRLYNLLMLGKFSAFFGKQVSKLIFLSR